LTAKHVTACQKPCTPPIVPINTSSIQSFIWVASTFLGLGQSVNYTIMSYLHWLHVLSVLSDGIEWHRNLDMRRTTPGHKSRNTLTIPGLYQGEYMCKPNRPPSS